MTHSFNKTNYICSIKDTTELKSLTQGVNQSRLVVLGLEHMTISPALQLALVQCSSIAQWSSFCVSA